MRFLIDNVAGKSNLKDLTFAQTKQAAAIMDNIARLIPHEGVDYDVEVTFKGDYNPSVSMRIIPLTEKGVWWQKYVMEMLKKHPPTVENPDMSIPDSVPEDLENQEGRANNEEVVS